MKKIAISFLATLWLSALAISPASSAGLGAGLSGKYINVEASGTESSGTTGSETDASSVSRSVNESSLIFSYYAEITAGENNGWALGYEAIPGAADVSDKVHERTDTETSNTSSATTTSLTRKQSASAELENHITLYLNYNLNDTYYVKGGVAQVDLTTDETLQTGAKYGDETVIGYVAGLGVNSGNWRTEVLYTDYEDISLTSSVARTGVTTNNKIDADLDTLALRVSYAF